jgi:hypothetical protein
VFILCFVLTDLIKELPSEIRKFEETSALFYYLVIYFVFVLCSYVSSVISLELCVGKQGAWTHCTYY